MKNNLEAVKEVVRQLRLRDIGGIIVIDFIDMSNPKNRETVEEALRTELERDRTKTYVVEISPARPRRDDAPERHRRPARDPHDASARSARATASWSPRRRTRSRSSASCAMLAQGLARAGASASPSIRGSCRCSPGPVGARLDGDRGGGAAAVLPRRRDVRQRARPPRPLRGARSRASSKTLRPAAPFEEGASLELKLVEVGLYDPTAGVGKVGRLRGRRRRRGEARRQEGRGDGRPRARRHGVRDAGRRRSSRPLPITFEAEAEKPTRALSARKTAAEPLSSRPPRSRSPRRQRSRPQADAGSPRPKRTGHSPASGQPTRRPRRRRRGRRS